MGSDNHYPEEAPAHPVSVDGFWMDRTPVTNADFERFLEATGYVTFAEIPPRAEDYPGALPDMLYAGSMVFVKPRHRVDLGACTWWHFVAEADVRHPLGPESSIEGLEDHPAVHVAYRDVEAYAEWVGQGLPTEAEWEFAARGGLDGAEYAWGDELYGRAGIWPIPGRANFPRRTSVTTATRAPSPVDRSRRTDTDCDDMIGNVWEWTTDWYIPACRRIAQTCCIPDNPRGGARRPSHDPAQPASRFHAR